MKLPLMGLIEGLTHAVGEEVRIVLGPPETRLTAPIGPDDTSASVESTLNLSSSGAVYVQGHRFTYTSKTDATLDGLASELLRVVTLPAGATVVLDVRAVPVGEDEGLSVLDQAWRDTLIHKAAGDAFTRLAELYSLPMPYAWPEQSWRDALHAVVLGPRGTPGCTFAFLEAALEHLATTKTVLVEKAWPRNLSAVSAFPGNLVGRMVRLDGIATGLYCVVGYFNPVASAWDATVTDGAHTTVTLCPVDCGYWQGANWAALPWPDGESDATVTATFLPFTLREMTPGPDYYDDGGLTDRKALAAGKPYQDPPLALTADDVAALATPYADDEPDIACKVIVLLADGVVSAPPTYLQLEAQPELPPPDNDRPAGEPFGGQLLENGLIDDGHVMVDGTDTGPWPIYLQGDSLLGVLEERLKVLLAAGVHARTMSGA